MPIASKFEKKLYYLHFVWGDLYLTESTSFKSKLAFHYQMWGKISFFHQHATLRMYTGNFDKLTAVDMGLYEKVKKL